MPVATVSLRTREKQKGCRAGQPFARSISSEPDQDTALALRVQRLRSLNVAEAQLSLLARIAWEIADARY